jgi:hypothetical protein
LRKRYSGCQIAFGKSAPQLEFQILIISSTGLRRNNLCSLNQILLMRKYQAVSVPLDKKEGSFAILVILCSKVQGCVLVLTGRKEG